MAKPPPNRTVEEELRARGIEPRMVKFGRLVRRSQGSTLKMTVEEFQRAAIGGRALDAADLCFIGLEQQVERSCQTPSDEASPKDILAHMADVELSPVLLLRLRRAATLIREHVENCQRLEDAIGAFNAAVPDLAHLRNTQEHFDDYILGRGRDEPKSGAGRAYFYPLAGPPTVERSGRSVDLGVALKAARELYEQIYRIATGEAPHLTKIRE